MILLRTSDSAFVKTELTDDAGAYSLSAGSSGSYFIKVLLTGYDAYRSETVVVADNNVAFPEIRLHETNSKLKEVTVNAQKEFVEVHTDKLVVNVKNRK